MNFIATLNRASVKTLQGACGVDTFLLWIEDGRITGYQKWDGKLHKEIPTQTANPSGD